MRRCGVLFSLGLALLSAGDAVGEVTDLQAAVEALSVERAGSGSTDVSTESYPGTANALPMEAFSGLGDFTGTGDPSHGSRAVATFRDPAASGARNPGEFGVEAAGYTLDPEVAYETTATAEETRSIVLDPVELDAGVDENIRRVRSTVYLEGAMFIWTDAAVTDLSDLAASFDVSVMQSMASGGTREVFSASVEVGGSSGGIVSMTSNEGIFALFGGPELLLIAADPETREVVEALQAKGQVHLVFVPPQALPYVYEAPIGSSFGLTAEVRSRAVTVPDGTAVAAVFGRDFRELADLAEAAAFDVSGDAVQRVVNGARSKIHAPTAGASPALCGALGAEALAVVGMSLCGAGRSLSRRRRARR